jgi:AhpD family alkylhydroperoxidase
METTILLALVAATLHLARKPGVTDEQIAEAVKTLRPQ